MVQVVGNVQHDGDHDDVVHGVRRGARADPRAQQRRVALEHPRAQRHERELGQRDAELERVGARPKNSVERKSVGHKRRRRKR